MAQDIRVKICGLREAAHVAAAVKAGAAYVGFDFFPKSPRYVDPAEAARLALGVPEGVAKVALTVDATDAELDALLDRVPLDMLQLHGHETPERVAEVRARFGLPVMKALGIADEGDLPALDDYARVADAAAGRCQGRPRGQSCRGAMACRSTGGCWPGDAGRVPWMLAGGLTAGNVAEAMRLTGARQVDVSSGVEIAPGVKDAGLIEAFCRAGAMILRDARQDDVAGIVALLSDDTLGAAREGHDMAPYDLAFAEIAANPMHQLVVAEAEGRIVGCLQLTILAGLSRQGARRALVEAVRVAGDLRSQGLGAALMAEAEDRARRAGCGMIQLTTDKSRLRAHRFYERLGYAASHLGMKKAL